MPNIQRFVLKAWRANDPLAELNSIEKLLTSDLCIPHTAIRAATRMAEALAITGISRDAFHPSELDPAAEYLVRLEVREIYADESIIHESLELPPIKP